VRYVSTGAQVRSREAAVIDGLGLPGIVLMETASRAVAMAVQRQSPKGPVVVVCGAGNNGGDGYGAARWLHGWGRDVSVVSLATSSPGDAGVMRAVCDRMGIRQRRDLGDASVIVDAVFGTGLNRPVVGRYAEVLQTMAHHPAQVVAVDIPSGLHADSGAVLGTCVPADYTVTFGMAKGAMYGEPGADHCGRVVVADIGLDAVDGSSRAEVPDAADLKGLLPGRSAAGHKRDAGHLLVVAGSASMAGAAVLSCRAALAASVGLCTLVASRGALPRLRGLPPEVMVLIAGDGDVIDAARLPDPSGYHAIAVGPGLGGGEPLPEALGFALRDWWRGLDRALVYDADAIAWALGAGPVGAARLTTPHPGEAARVLGCASADIQADRFEAVERLSADHVVLLKGRNTLVGAPQHLISINTPGHAVLSTGGSGDVLTGVSGALLAQGCSDRDAGRLAAWVHGTAGVNLARKRAGGWTASDIAHEVPEAVDQLRRLGLR
jgi:ADP-dependent NAD(P)H-hydrate dehydratase / NAD(P)H-hydrate epimerase